MPDSAQELGRDDARRQPSTHDEDGVNATSTPLSMSTALRMERNETDEIEDYTIEPAPQLPEFNTETGEFADDDDIRGLTDDEITQLLQASSDDNADYYILLGLSKDQAPTDSQIRAAYHRLSLAFHPDKQPPYLKSAAEGHFTRLRRAYETLIEPRKRVIYDLEGEEGVQEEYREGGAMGPGGEAASQLSQVKVMKPNEFKKWFLGVMRGRERRALAALVKHETSFHIGLDATGNFTDSYKVVKVGDDEEYTFPLESLQLQDIGVSSSFSVPLPQLGKLLERPIPSFKQLTSWSTNTTEEEDEEEPPAEWIDALLPTNPSLTITGGISGELDQQYAILEAVRVGGTKIPITDRFYTMSTQNISLGASLSHTFPELLDAPPNTLASKLQGFNIELEANVLPHPAHFVVGLGKAISFVSNTQPFYLGTKFIVRDAPHIVPPEVQIQLTRPLGIKGDKTAFLMWQSGEQQWPKFLGGVLGSFIPIHAIALDYVARWQAVGRAAAIMRMGVQFSRFPDIEDGETAMLSPDSVNSTSVALTAHMAALALEMKHSFDLFAVFAQPPVRSRILYSGDEAAPDTKPAPHKARGVKVELAAAVSLPVTLTASVTGRRRFGNFTTLGLGVGLNPNLGLHLSVSWERLGNSIDLPVMLVPLDATTRTSLVLALGIPWATYTALEFLVLRPRATAKRQRLIKQQRKKLRADIKKRREEAEQAVELMSPSVTYRQSVEDTHGGLVVLSAQYGVSSKKSKAKSEQHIEWEEGKVIDVTIALAALVDDSQLSLARGLDKSRLIGFWDPSPLERKALAVTYEFEGKRHFVKVSGGKGLILPRREHELKE